VFIRTTEHLCANVPAPEWRMTRLEESHSVRNTEI
jgi:hypothetical protein